MGSRQSAVSSQQSAAAVGSQQSAVSSRQLAVGSRQAAVGSRQSAASSRQSAVGSRQPVVGSCSQQQSLVDVRPAGTVVGWPAVGRRGGELPAPPASRRARLQVSGRRHPSCGAPPPRHADGIQLVTDGERHVTTSGATHGTALPPDNA